MTQYVYDMKYGHYRVLNEDDNANTEQSNSQETQNAENNDQDKQETANNSLQNLETEDVLKLRQEKSNKLKEQDNKIQQKNNNIIQVQQTLDKALEGQQPTNELQKKLLQAKKELIDVTFEKAKIEHDMEDKILQVQTSLVESIIMDSMPSRYNGLNEEQLMRGKIYLNTLIDNDPYHIVNEMNDFKKIMGHANLLYGKDETGYFAICMDQYDLGRLTKVLEKAGYLKESIDACCFSQIYL